MPLFRTCSTAALMAIVSSAPVAGAQERNPVGDARSALPGIHRIPTFSDNARLAAAVDAGYGLTESQKSEGTHHRILGSVALGLVPMPGLEFGLLGGIRHDRHPNDSMGSDSGTLGQVSMLARWGTRYGRGLRVGADLGVSFPGAEKPMDSISSPAIDVRALLGWVPTQGLRYAGFAGFRFDQTAGVGSNASRYRTGDRLALGLSDFNAILVGVGAAMPLGRFELLGEVTGDLLVGGAAPTLVRSPLRLNLGVRHVLSSNLQIELLSELALSARPDTVPGSPLIPVEPRFGISLGLRYRLWSRAERPSVPGEPALVRLAPLPKSNDKPASAPPVATAPATGQMLVTVFDPSSHPLSDAIVELANDAGTRVLEFKGGSSFFGDGVPVGHAHLKVRAELMRDWERDVEIVSGEALELRVDMMVAENSAQIRGSVRAFDGRTLPAHVRIDPGAREVQAGPDGAFNVDVPPGKYQVKLWLDGYLPQERVVEVGKSGVMVLNVDMQNTR